MSFSISLAMIVKNEEDHLRATLDSAVEAVDEIVIVDTGSTDDTKGVISAFTAAHPEVVVKVYDFEWVEDFSKARNFSFSKCTGDAVLWLDGDDILVNPERLRRAVRFHFRDEEYLVDKIVLPYNYRRDPFGNVTERQLRERVTRRGTHEWTREIHEFQVQKYALNTVVMDNVWVDHESPEDSEESRSKRNLRVATKAVEKYEEGQVPAYLHFYRGQALRALDRVEDSVSAYKKYLELSDWKDERQMAMVCIAMMYRHQKEYNEAIRWAKDGTMENTANPNGWLELAEAYHGAERWGDCLNSLRHLKECEDPPKELPHDPTRLTLRPAILAAKAFVGIGDTRSAIKAYDKIVKAVPDDPGLQEMATQLEEMKRQQDLHDAFLEVAAAYREDGNHKAELAIRSVPPKRIAHFPGIIGAHKPDGKYRLVIYCGPTDHAWGPASLTHGVGGSEEAVIHVANRFAKAGWAVEVYCSTPMDGIVEGVAWNPPWAIDENNDFSDTDVFLAWRSPRFLSLGKKARLRGLWLHDIPVPQLYSPKYVDLIDFAFVLSEYHKGLYADLIPEDKMIVTRNGIAEDWLEAPQQKDGPLEFIYASAPDRGLEPLIKEIWPKIREKHQDAVLRVFYGFETYMAANKDQPTKFRWAQDLMQAVGSAEGVEYHGKVGQRELAEWYSKAHYWLYFTSFPEISCISAMKAQACGCWPMTSGYAALAETQKFGWKSSDGRDVMTEGGKDAINVAIIAVLDQIQQGVTMDDRKEMSEWAMKAFSWDSLVQDWVGHFKRMLKGKPKVEKKQVLQRVSSPTT